MDDVARLIQDLKQKDTKKRRRAVKVLVSIGAPAVPPLCEALRSRHRGVRGRAASALGEIGDGRAVLPLLDALQDKTRWVRQQAAAALVEISGPAVRPLCEALVRS